jgi:folate-binding Fe-S cluster repair protein YgfZ
VNYDGFAPEPGLPVLAGDKPIGTMGSGAQGRGIAMLRLDRLADALATARPVTAGGIAIRPVKPQWAQFAFPTETTAAK